MKRLIWLIMAVGLLFPASVFAAGLEVKSLNGTSGHVAINESGTLEWFDNNVGSMSADVKDNSIDEVRLKIDNSPSANLFLKSNGGNSMSWAVATNTITASPTITSTSSAATVTNPTANNFNITVNAGLPLFNANKIQGTDFSNASPTALYRIPYYDSGLTDIIWSRFVAGTGISFSESTVNGSNTFTISSVSTATTTYYLVHTGKSPTNDGFGGVVDPDKNSIYLDASTNHGIDWGDVFVPNTWDGTSDLIPRFTVFTPAGASAATITLQLRAQILKQGSTYWSASGYTIFATASFLLASNNTIQTFQANAFRVPAASMTAGCQVHVQFFRIPGAAADTHAANVHFDSLNDKISVQ